MSDLEASIILLQATVGTLESKTTRLSNLVVPRTMLFLRGWPAYHLDLAILKIFGSIWFSIKFSSLSVPVYN